VTKDDREWVFTFPPTSIPALSLPIPPHFHSMQVYHSKKSLGIFPRWNGDHSRSHLRSFAPLQIPIPKLEFYSHSREILTAIGNLIPTVISSRDADALDCGHDQCLVM